MSEFIFVLSVTNMAIVQNFQVICGIFNVLGVCNSENLA